MCCGVGNEACQGGGLAAAEASWAISRGRQIAFKYIRPVVLRKPEVIRRVRVIEGHKGHEG